MYTVLVTGFGPFGEHKVNASWEAVKLLEANAFKNIKLVTLEIPVEYRYVQEKLPLLWKDLKPKLVVHVGVSALTDKLQLETVAHKSGYMRKDCLGLFHETADVCLAHEDCIQTDLDVGMICAAVVKETGLNICPSVNAGRYLCEFTYFTSLNIDRSRTLFVHVPPLGKPYTAEEISCGLLHVIAGALEQL